MKHLLSELSYPKNALEPFISEETLDYHYDKHYQGYVDKLNELIPGTRFEKQSLDQIVQSSSGAIFHNAAQAWNHAFFWRCLAPDHHQISYQVSTLIVRDFGSVDEFKKELVQKGSEHFGSGWLWLIQENKTLKIEATHDADNPLKGGKHAILTCDLWEHAYYIDYRNERSQYLEGFVEIINWDFVESNLKEAMKQVA